MRATIAMATNRAAIIPPMMPATGEPPVEIQQGNISCIIQRRIFNDTYTQYLKGQRFPEKGQSVTLIQFAGHCHLCQLP